MIYKYVRSTAALLIAAMLISALYGCSLIPDDGEDPITDFTAPYIDNYYVNKHDPVCVSGNMTVYKYNSPDATLLTMGGHDYRGGFVIEKEWSSAELGCVELPLGGQYENISFVIGGNYSIKKVALNEKGEEIYQSDHTYSGSYPTLTGQETETRAAVQFLIDGKIADEILIPFHRKAIHLQYFGRGKLLIQNHGGHRPRRHSRNGAHSLGGRGA